MKCKNIYLFEPHENMLPRLLYYVGIRVRTTYIPIFYRVMHAFLHSTIYATLFSFQL